MATATTKALADLAEDLQKHWRPLDGALGFIAFGASELGEAIGHFQDETGEWEMIRKLIIEGEKHLAAGLELLGVENLEKAGAIVPYAQHRAAIAQELRNEMERRLAAAKPADPAKPA